MPSDSGTGHHTVKPMGVASPMYPHLFQPANIGTLQLKNRILGAATVTNMATVDGSVSERTIAH